MTSRVRELNSYDGLGARYILVYIFCVKYLCKQNKSAGLSFVIIQRFIHVRVVLQEEIKVVVSASLIKLCPPQA